MKQQNNNCMLCPDLVKSRKRITWGYGDDKSIIIFIGEAPGRRGCDITGIPFTQDVSGVFFQDCLAEIGLISTKVYTTNVVKCCPKSNRTPSSMNVQNCKKYIDYEIKTINPKIIIPMGKVAVEYIFGKQTTISKLVGRRYNIDGRIIYPIYHPSYIVRIKTLIPKYKKMFQEIKKLYEDNKNDN